jgi:uncharacterized protein YbaR (Trm112 family)
MQTVIACPHCRGSLQVDTAWAGQAMNCPLCRMPFLAPAASPAPAMARPLVATPPSTTPPHFAAQPSAPSLPPVIQEQPRNEFDFTSGSSSSGRGSSSVAKKYKKKSNAGFWAAGGGVGITILAIVLRLAAAGVNVGAYYSDCNEAQEVSYQRYSQLGPSGRVHNAVDRNHEACVRMATEGSGKRRQLNPEKYFAEMDRRMSNEF